MKSINKIFLVNTIIISIALIGVAICLAMYSEEVERKNSEIDIIQEECQHDWRVTSKYVFLRNTYKTISKCSVCGKEID